MISSSFLHSLSPSHTSCLLRSTRVWLNEVREWSVCKGRERHGTSDGGWWWSLGVGGNDVGERDHHLHSLHTLRSGHEWHGNEGPERGVVGIQVGREPACLSVTFTHIHSPPYPTPLPLHTRVTTERRHVTRVMGSEGVEVVRHPTDRGCEGSSCSSHVTPIHHEPPRFYHFLRLRWKTLGESDYVSLLYVVGSDGAFCGVDVRWNHSFVHSSVGETRDDGSVYLQSFRSFHLFPWRAMGPVRSLRSWYHLCLLPGSGPVDRETRGEWEENKKST